MAWMDTKDSVHEARGVTSRPAFGMLRLMADWRNLQLAARLCSNLTRPVHLTPIEVSQATACAGRLFLALCHSECPRYPRGLLDEICAKQ